MPPPPRKGKAKQSAARPKPVEPQQNLEPSPPRWALTWQGRTWTEDALTGQHMAIIVLIHGQDEWGNIMPTAGPVRLMAVLAAFIAVADGRPVDEVNAELARAPASELLGALTMV